MAKYRKKPVVIEAFLWPHDNPPQWWKDALAKPVFEDGAAREYIDGQPSMYAKIATLEGDMKVNPHDMVIQGVKGEIYPCKPNIFFATYDPA